MVGARDRTYPMFGINSGADAEIDSDCGVDSEAYFGVDTGADARIKIGSGIGIENRNLLQ